MICVVPFAEAIVTHATLLTCTTSTQQDLETLSELASTVFNSILLHRAQDFHEEVRATAMRHLLDFVRFDLKRPIHVEYLKYLGRACSDYSAQARMEAVCAIRNLVEVSVALLCEHVVRRRGKTGTVLRI
jgi:hypothetical protein